MKKTKRIIKVLEHTKPTESTVTKRPQSSHPTLKKRGGLARGLSTIAVSLVRKRNERVSATKTILDP